MRPSDDGVRDADREEVRAPVPGRVGGELHVPALVSHARDDKPDAGPGVQQLVNELLDEFRREGEQAVIPSFGSTLLKNEVLALDPAQVTQPSQERLQQARLRVQRARAQIADGDRPSPPAAPRPRAARRGLRPARSAGSGS